MTTRTAPARAGLLGLAVALMFATPLAAQTQIEGLDADVTVAFDSFSVPTIQATTEHDAILMQGYLHARERFFQMDFLRRTFAGTLAELVGSAALPQDVQLRTLGLSRAAQASVAVQTPEVTAWLEAYAEGVNSWLNDLNNPLPPEYAGLEIDRGGIPQWETIDSMYMVKGLAFNLSFSTADIDRTIAFLTMQAVGGQLGFSGIGLFYTDTYRTAPFDLTVSIPDGAKRGPWAGKPSKNGVPAYLNAGTLRGLLKLRETIQSIPILRDTLRPMLEDKGSNWFVASGALTESGYPMLANDPHLSLDTAATFSESHLIAADTGLNVTGVSFPGVPGIVQGCNETICWGSTVNGIDVTDIYQEVVVAIPTEGIPPGTPTHTIFEGAPEPMAIIPQTFGVNILNGTLNTVAPDAGVPPDMGGITWVVPRRNFGPILAFDFDNPDLVTAFSAAYVGWGPTQELECFRRFAHAASKEDFKAGLQFFDFGSQNWSYADVNGNIAYYTSGELPIREDLQLLQGPAGFQPPLLIRDGTHTLPHEWLDVQNPQPNQVLNREILPFDEMPQIENPESGYILNANNDPIGTTTDNVSFNQLRDGGGVLYLSPLYAQGMRMGRIQRLFDAALAGGDPSFTTEDFKAYQGNNQMLDAEVLLPYLLTAFDNAGDPAAPPPLAGLGADPAIAEAIGRLSAWDFSTPTGIQAGYDPGDNPFDLPEPTQDEIDASVAATIYSTWRGQAVKAIIDGTLVPRGMGGVLPGSGQAMSSLRFLLEERNGLGVSGLNFFFVPGIDDQDDARDILLLNSLASALGLLASDDFAAAFGNSTNQEDYRWGYLHRIVFDSFLGSVQPALNIPGPFDPFENVSPELLGVARSGGLNVVDASSHSARADGVNEFQFGSGPNRRFVGTLAPGCPVAEEVIPGGVSGIPGSPNTWDQLFLWLTNQYKPLAICADQVAATTVREEDYSPEPPLLVVLESFTAEVTSDGVLVRWTTASELDTVGFRVLRSAGEREKGLVDLTPQLIPARGQETVGASYEFLDRSASRGKRLVYYLEDIDLFGRSTRHGPAILDPRPSGRGRVAQN